MEKDNKQAEEIKNPMNSAGEFLYYEEEYIKDKAVEGTVLESGFINGLIGGTLIKE